MRSCLRLVFASVATILAASPGLAVEMGMELDPGLPGLVEAPGGVMVASCWVEPQGTVPDRLRVTVFDPNGTIIFDGEYPNMLEYEFEWTAPADAMNGIYRYQAEYYAAENPEEPAASVGEGFLVAGATTGICAFKFIDDDGDGIFDEEEEELAEGWEICFSGPIEDCRVTDAYGSACLFFIPAGTYEVCETMQDGYVNTTPICQEIVIETGVIGKAMFGNMAGTPTHDSSWGELKAIYR